MDKPALIVIDVQREYFDPDGPLRLPDGPVVLDRLVPLVNQCRDQHIPVIHIVHEEPAGSGVFEPGSTNVTIMPQVDPKAGEPRILKHLPGAFDNTNLDDVLRGLGTRTVIISGFMTHMCCDTTAREAQARGYDVVFLADGTATRDLEAPSGRLVPHDQVQETILAAQADGFSVVRAVSDVADEIRRAD
jgi:nicotinamidase-related amidase